MTKLEALKSQYKKAVSRVEEVLDQQKNDFMRDSAIQRFEFTFDLSWKLLKAILEDEYGIISKSPKSVFRDAYKYGIIEYDDIWITMTDKRNESAHIYKEETADEIYKMLPKFLENFQVLLKVI